ncbi:MAG: molecular chaperone [Rhodanobacter sp.]
MRRNLGKAGLAALFAGWLLASGTVLASGLQVSPVSLHLKAVQTADGLWLSNTGSSALHAQIRVYHWTQQDDADQLEPSRGLVISPPMLEIKPGDRQLIRVIRVGAPPNGANAVEDAYRLAIDELPIDATGAKGLQFVLHYSVPIFLEPAGNTEVTPELHWQLQRVGAQAVLEVSNTGTGHAQLATVSFVNRNGKRVEVSNGLLGYVLPGATMHWTLKQPATNFAGGGTFEVKINGASATQNITLADRTH